MFAKLNVTCLEALALVLRAHVTRSCYAFVVVRAGGTRWWYVLVVRAGGTRSCYARARVTCLEALALVVVVPPTGQQIIRTVCGGVGEERRVRSRDALVRHPCHVPVRVVRVIVSRTISSTSSLIPATYLHARESVRSTGVHERA